MSSYNYIDSSGSSIQCLFDAGTKIPARVINQYCWIMSTFTLPKHYNGIPGQDMLHFGVGTYAHNELKPGKKSILAGQCTVFLKG